MQIFNFHARVRPLNLLFLLSYVLTDISLFRQLFVPRFAKHIPLCDFVDLEMPSSGVYDQWHLI